jgi:hypothetical protein
MASILLSNARLFNGVNNECPEGMQVLVDDDVIGEVSDRPM